jgi:hypothetical protein
MLGVQASLGWRRPVSIQQLRWGERGGAASAPLVDVAAMKSSAALWDIARGRDFDLVVSSPRVDGGLTADGVLRLQAAAEVGVMPFQCPFWQCHAIMIIAYACSLPLTEPAR